MFVVSNYLMSLSCGLRKLRALLRVVTLAMLAAPSCLLCDHIFYSTDIAFISMNFQQGYARIAPGK